ncbi:MAG: hypothetical protein L0Z50_21510, partial [Verrucomicrobiales bacterium]|nr:hypothetical protein [Verrucomicrobiales bacterium]
MNAKESNDLSIFNAALEIATPEDRAAYLDRACAGNIVLRSKIDSLLAAYGKESDTFDDLALDSTKTIPSGPRDGEAPGTVIGRYKLLQKIGEGGMGAVYMAEQEEPVRRRVALKIIKLGMDTKSVIARFEAERQALALMDHPNIAKIFDAGTTECTIHEPEGGARHSVRAEAQPEESGAQGTDAPYQSRSILSAGR